jgi:hypothetical protein
VTVWFCFDGASGIPTISPLKKEKTARQKNALKYQNLISVICFRKRTSTAPQNQHERGGIWFSARRLIVVFWVLFLLIKFMSLLTVVLKQFLHKRNADCFKFVPFLQIMIFPLEKPNSNQTFQHVILCFRLSSSRCTSYWCKYSDTPYASFYKCFQLSSAEDLTSYNVFCF